MAASSNDYIPVHTNVSYLDCADAWKLLTPKEQLYAYYFGKASWEGAKICTFQRSYESPGLHVLFRALFSEGIEKLREKAKANGVTDLEWRQLLAYSAGVLQNCGNYKSFGDKKFIPELSAEKFLAIIKVSTSFEHNKESLLDIWEEIKDVIYRKDPPYKILGFRNENGLTSYYSSNIARVEAEIVKEFQEEAHISPLNTRLIKLYDKLYWLRIASAQKGELPYIKSHKWKDVEIIVENGEFAPFMKKTVDNLKLCEKYVANENQHNMIRAYIDHFQFGDIEKHKDSQRHWIRDVNPTVETVIGFTETMVDPLGVRAEFEGFVAVVNKEESKKLSNLVSAANELIQKLPWSKEFEKDVFKKPDFTSLEVASFASSETPLGICLPNYDEIRQHFGYKNVNLSNSYPIPSLETTRFVDPADIPNYIKYFKDSEFLLVALHELLGHGSGKLLQEESEGKLNFPTDLKNPLTGEPITTYYKLKETYESKFGHFHSAYEECRADTVAYYLSCFDEPMKILFAGRESEWEDIVYYAWHGMIVSGIKGLEHYNVEEKKWMQAHVNAAYVIMKVLLEAGNDLVTFAFSKNAAGEDYVVGKLDKTKLKTVGKKAITDFLHKLHIYKAIGDLEGAKKFFEHYSVVDDNLLKIRAITMQHKMPRRLEVQGNLYLKKTDEVTYIGYDKSFEGIIKSFVERFEEAFDTEMYLYWKAQRHFLSLIHI
eukprot:TRINITY_DN501_c0_g1_i1.p1 TRINITY_DN501_c0_g1~~TRINITY_DN501_c0_g1_i1.p1  ORF type:complete len:713 (+),score=157.24 TRINITY_DN501_c0_g1_i1:43-2181(+)